MPEQTLAREFLSVARKRLPGRQGKAAREETATMNQSELLRLIYTGLALGRPGGYAMVTESCAPTSGPPHHSRWDHLEMTLGALGYRVQVWMES